MFSKGSRSIVGIMAVGLAVLAIVGTSAPVGAAPAKQATPLREAIASRMSPSAVHGKLVIPVNCTFNGVASNGVLGGTLTGVSPGESVEIVCFGGFVANSEVAVGEESPLVVTSAVPSNETDGGAIEIGSADADGNFNGVFTIPNPFVAPDPNAVCPPTDAQANLGGCILAITDGLDLAAITLQYAPSTTAPPTTPASPGATNYTGMASTPNGDGYWLTNTSGAVFPHGKAGNFGSMAGQLLNAPISHIVATPDGLGYWLVASDGGTFAFGDAHFYCSMGGQHLYAPVVDLTPTLSGHGYWLVASDGGVFAFGDAVFRGSMGGQHLNQPVVGISADNATGGYWEVATDGGIFAFGAPFFGSTGSIHLNQPVNGMTATANGQGYWFVASDGGIFSGGNARFFGSMGATPLNQPVVGMTADYATGGYWLVASDGGIFSFNAPFYGAA